MHTFIHFRVVYDVKNYLCIFYVAPIFTKIMMKKIKDVRIITYQPEDV